MCMQTFFIRDGLQFPDLNRALRPDPVYNLQQGWRILDFNSHHPESILQACLPGAHVLHPLVLMQRFRLTADLPRCIL